MQKIVFSLLAICLVIILVLSLVYLDMRTEDAYTETLEFQVVDKYTERTRRSTTPRTIRYRYYIVIHANGAYAEVEDTVNVSKETFENIKVGDTITCTVTYDEHGVLNLKVESWN